MEIMAQKIELLLPRGMRDIPPEEALLQNTVLDTIREVFELFGYSPLETPAVERMEILTAKFAAGEGTDVSHEIFKVLDQGERSLGLRFDMTVPLARFIAMNPTVKLPFKRYAIGKVFRDGPIKLGRYREFIQADGDIVGVAGTLADSEGVLIAREVFRRLGLEVHTHCSSRELLREIMDLLEISEASRAKTIIALDKLKKIGEKEVLKEMIDHAGVPEKKAKEFLTLCSPKKSQEETLRALEEKLPGSQALKTIREILGYLKEVPDLHFDPSLARGLTYYTGFFFECVLKKSIITSSLVGTGRYDRMIGDYLGGEQQFPAVGISFGVSVICDALKEKGMPTRKTPTQVYLAPIGGIERPYAMEILNTIRRHGIRSDIDMLERSPGKNMAYANALGIPFVILVGEKEREEKKVTLKNMESGDQQMLSLEEAIKVISEL